MLCCGIHFFPVQEQHQSINAHTYGMDQDKLLYIEANKENMVNECIGYSNKSQLVAKHHSSIQ